MRASTLQRVWIRTVRPSVRGRDLVVGDVHGCFRTLDRALCELRFNTDFDRLFGVGDLIDRGPHSAEALAWLESRFDAVAMGNHERPLLYWFDPHRRPLSLRRPDWLRRVPRTQQRRWRAALARTPAAVTIETAYGAVGLVHADVPHLDWAVATVMLEAGAPDHVDIALLGPDAPEQEVRRHCSPPVKGLRALVHGQFVVDEVERLANPWSCFTSTRGAFARGRSTSTRGSDGVASAQDVASGLPCLGERRPHHVDGGLRGAACAAPVSPAVSALSSSTPVQKRSAALSRTWLVGSPASLACREPSRLSTASGASFQRVPVRTVRFPASPSVSPA